MDSRKYLVLLLALAVVAVFAAGCTSSKPATTTPSPASAATSSAAQAPSEVKTVTPAPTTTPCPDKEVLTGNWDSRMFGYASNHDIRETEWNGHSPSPVTLSQKCWDAAGTFKDGDCQGTLTGKIDKNVYMGKYTIKCSTDADSSAGTFAVTMAADNQSFMGAMYSDAPGSYGPEAGFPPSWWAKKTV